MSTKIREYTNKILNAIADGSLDRDDIITACMKYMSESQVEDMCRANDLFQEEEEEEEEEEGVGYCSCKCRDCMEIAIGNGHSMCMECEDAGCTEDEECKAYDACEMEDE